ncbi:MAG: CoA ester lyase [Thermodesulfobacteriota bacterium]
MDSTVQRSMLILPVHVKRFVEKAYLRGADAVVLDLEDSVPAAQKEEARGFVQEAVVLAGRGGADVLVRVNNDPSLLEHDLAAAIWPGVHAVFVPKVESAKDVANVEGIIENLEKNRNMPLGAIRLSLHVESPVGILNIREIAYASERTESMSLGVDDYCLEMGLEQTGDGSELFLPLSLIVMACRARKILPMGLLASVAEYSDLTAFERAARRGRELGTSGALCIHPDQVTVLNRVFSPTEAEVDHARRVVRVFEEGVEAGRAAVSLNGRMVDTPIYKRARALLDHADAIAAKEQQKAKALALLEVS